METENKIPGFKVIETSKATASINRSKSCDGGYDYYITFFTPLYGSYVVNDSLKQKGAITSLKEATYQAKEIINKL